MSRDRWSDLNEATQRDVLDAAILATDHRLSNTDIAEVLEVSESTVSRWISVASDFGVIEPPRLRDNNIAEHVKAGAGIRLCERCLSDRLQAMDPLGHFRRVKITVEPSEIKPDDWSKRLAAHADRAGPYVAELLAPTENVGLAWGKTIGETAKRVAHSPAWANRKKKTQRRYIATTGELVEELARGDSPAWELSSSHLAEYLASFPPIGKADALRSVPAMISMNVPKEEVKIIKDYYSRWNAAHRAVFSGTRPLVGQLNAILTSVGSMDQPGKLWSAELREGGVDKPFLARLDGDIGGVLLADDSKLSKQDECKLHEVRDRWLGITEDHYRACAAKASPGVIVVALGNNKDRATLACVKRSLVNVLVVDRDLARGLSKLVPPCDDTNCTVRLPTLGCHDPDGET